ncbi:MAG: rRNA maturation RNase YbeY [Candidatus Kerfeldbacteria bacterium]
MPCDITAHVALPFPEGTVKRWAHQMLRSLGYKGVTTALSVAFVGDSEMRAINRRYHHSPGTTDVLSFPGERRGDLGEIVMSLPQARRQAREYGHTIEAEVRALLAHGILHLVGYSHGRPKHRERMKRAERLLLGGHSLIQRSIHTP